MGKRLKKETEKEGLTPEQEFRMDLYYWLQALVAALIAIVMIFTFLGRVIGVKGSSMYPTLHHGDMMLVQSLGYSPKQGDVVVLTKESFMSDAIVKRIIAVGGQTVRIDYNENKVYVDGALLEEDYINLEDEDPMREMPLDYYSEVTVPEGSIFVMGDNRNGSTDSRSPNLGLVDERYVIGHVLCVLFPFQNIGGVG
ncbi:MAG: signal peptidase I [Oscillospiraceae bacterium]|nr:signal peptidase I [Oscillospiraceae bacterium]